MNLNKNIKFFGVYELHEMLAEGVFSQIFEVSSGGQRFALKKLRPHLMFDNEYTILLETEGRLLTKIQDPEHFPQLFAQGKQGDEHYLVMELIEGLNLERAIERSYEKKLPATAGLGTYIALEICKGLEALEDLSLFSHQATVHGDLRASNVMLSRDGKIKMIDLGLKGGTFDYMPLERLHDERISAYTDIYALGHILYELFHGQRLFKGKTKLESYMEMRDLKIEDNLFRTSLPIAIRKILMKCLNQEEGKHYSDLKGLRRDLELFLEAEPCKILDVQQWIRQLLA